MKHNPFQLWLIPALLCLVVGACSEDKVDAAGAGGECNEVGNANCHDYQSEMCAKRSPEDCGQLSYCSRIVGTKLDEERACFGASEVVGCSAIGCTALITYAEHEGETWKFPNGCIPRGWSEAPTIEADACSPGKPGEGGAGGMGGSSAGGGGAGGQP